VSGVVFEVQSTSARVEAGGKTLYVCCAGCAQHLTANLEHVLERRGIDVRS
jgi:hypothetical protein